MSTLNITHAGTTYTLVVSNSGCRLLLDGAEVYKSWGDAFHVATQADMDATAGAELGDTIYLGPGTFTASFDDSEPVRVLPEPGLIGVVAFQVS